MAHSVPHRIFYLVLGFLHCLSLSSLAISQDAAVQVVAPPLRHEFPLDAGWEIQTRGDTEWKSIHVGDSWESVLGMKFDGIATYRCRLPQMDRQPKQRLLLEFDGVATEAVVKIGDRIVGKHLGGWTTWNVDITDAYKHGAWLSVEVDEKVGHNTQGFLPVFLPHFGGIWQKVRLRSVPEVSIDESKLMIAGWRQENGLDIQGTLRSTANANGYRVSVRVTDGSNATATDLSVDEKGHFSGKLPIDKPRRWSPTDPFRYIAHLELKDENGIVVDQYRLPVAMRHIQAKGRQLLLNSEPVVVRGVLNWGYAPPRIAPSLEESFMKQEIQMAKAMGFNLMKFCLWIPPKRYLELCDEMGMLSWVEYPTWHPKLTGKYLEELRHEYDEFFLADRNHPSIVLRSLTCETGPSAELQVMQSLYDRGKELIPECLIEDDSSWISWNRVHDFYDDHPYGNNHTWSDTLTKLEEYMAPRAQKPLVLGEAIAADTWNTTPFDRIALDSVHHLRSASRQEAYQRQLQEWCGEDVIDSLESDARRNGMAMRRFQIERYREQMVGQGYVISVLRDFPFASMGLIDFQNRPKWRESEWSWHRDRITTLHLGNAVRSLAVDREGKVRLAASALRTIEVGGEAESQRPFKVSMRTRKEDVLGVAKASVKEGEYYVWSWPLSEPTPVQLLVEYEESAWNRQWDLWLVPEVGPDSLEAFIDESIAVDDERLRIFRKINLATQQVAGTENIVIAANLSPKLLEDIEKGARVLLLPNGKAGSVPVADHWFLRGGVVRGMEAPIPLPTQNMMAELQPFDLAGPVIRQPEYLDEVTPLMLLWDNHDIDHYRTHAVAYVTAIGKGRLLVSTFQHAPSQGAAGPYVLQELYRVLRSKDSVRSLSASRIQRLKSDLSDRERAMPAEGWSFRPDPHEEGINQNWHMPDTDRSDWKSIAIGKHWDSQGYGAVDGWAWYVRKMPWPKEVRYLTFTGVDDYFEVYLNGKKIGSGGDRQQRITAFEQTISIQVPDSIQEGHEVTLAIRVEDWQGAGGIFRPVLMSRMPKLPGPPMVVRKQDP